MIIKMGPSELYAPDAVPAGTADGSEVQTGKPDGENAGKGAITNYNNIVGDAFAPRNPYCLKIDTLEEPPMFQISDTHFAKTWLLDPRAPKVEKPSVIENTHEKLIHAFNI